MGYDARNRLLSQSGPVPGRTMAYGYDLVGNRVEELHANGRHIAHRFDALNRPTESEDLLGGFDPPVFSRMQYDADGNEIARTDGNGNETTFVVDALSRTTAEHRPLNRTLRWTYNVFGEVLTATDAENATTTFEFDQLGRTVRSIAPAPFNYETLMAYDDSGHLIDLTDPRGFTTSYVNDGLGRRTQQTDPPLQVVPPQPPYQQTWTFDAAGNVVAQTDRRGIETRMSYDGENRLLTTRLDGVLKRRQVFDLAGNLVQAIDANGAVTTHQYNAANERLRSTRPGDVIDSWTYTPWGDVATATDADGITTTSTYDLRRRPVSSSRPDGNGGNAVTQSEYDGHGNLTARVLPSSSQHRWQYGFDAAHRLVNVRSPLGHTTTYGYDRADRRTRITDAASRSTLTAFDALGRPTRIDHADATFEQFTQYDGNGNLLQRIDANGQSIDSNYDVLNRMTQRRWSGASAPSDIRSEDSAYDPNGQLVAQLQRSVDGSQHTIVNDWDRQRRLAREVDRFGTETLHEYDPQDNRIARSDPAGRSVFVFDQLNRLRSVQPATGSTSEAPVALDYTPAGRLLAQIAPNGAHTSHTYDAAGRLRTIVHTQSGVEVARLVYRHDANGNRSEQTQTTPVGVRRTTYTYDRDDRLTGSDEQTEDGHLIQTRTTLDAVGNRLTEVVTDNGAPVSSKTFSYNARHGLTSQSDSIDGSAISYAFDANGSLIEETRSTPQATIGYRRNPQDRLATLTAPTGPPVDYQYDGAGRRVEKRSLLEARRFGWDGTRLRRETNVASNLLATYEWGAGRVLHSRQQSATRYPQHDALATPIRWSSADGSQQSKRTIDAWGVTTTQQGDLPPIGYTGHYLDNESGDYYAQQRYYRAGVGRFSRVDPGPFVLDRPITLNRYLYANGNPVAYIDADGRIALAADGADRLAEFRGWLEHRADRYEDNVLGGVGATFGGVARGLVAAGEGALRTANYAVNWGSVVLGAVGLNREEWAESHAAEISSLHGGVAETADFLVNKGGARQLYAGAVDRASFLYEGDVQAIGDTTEFAVGIVSGGGTANSTVRTTAGAAQRAAAKLEAAARTAAERTKAAMRGAKRIEEGGDGLPAVALDRRLDMLPENDFRGDAIEHPVSRAAPRASYALGQSDGGPGVWATRHTPTRGAQYQGLITGAPRHVEYVVPTDLMKSGELKFDGFDPDRNMLLDAKDWHAWPKDAQWSRDVVLGELRKQSAVASSVGAKVEWHIPSSSRAEIVSEIMRENRIRNVRVVVSPSE